jgi:tight adherence protein B
MGCPDELRISALNASTGIFIYLMIFFGALLAFEGVRPIAESHAGEIRHKNRRMIVQGVDETRIAEVLFLNHSTRSARTKGPVESFQRIVAHANLPIGMRALIACLISFAVVIFLAASQFVTAPAAAVTALLLGFGLPKPFLTVWPKHGLRHSRSNCPMPSI